MECWRQTRGQGEVSEVSGSPDPLGVVAQNAKMDQGFVQMPGVQATYPINQSINQVYHSLS